MRNGIVEPRAPQNMRSMLGRSVLAVFFWVAVAIVFAVGVCEWTGWPFLRAPIERLIAAQVKREVSFGEDFRLSLFGGLRLSSDRFEIGPPPDRPKGSPDEFVQANDVELRLPYSTLLGPLRGSQDPLRVSSLSVAQLSANLWRGTDGRANWELGRGDDRGEPVVLPHFDRLVVREGRIRIDDAVSSVHAGAMLSTEEGTMVGDPGGLKVSARGTYQGRPLRVQLSSSGLLPLAQSSAERPLPVTVKAEAGGARLDFEGQAADVLKLESLKGDFALSGKTLAAVGEAVGLPLPNSPAFEMQGALRKSGPVWEADIESFVVGDSELAGAFTYDPQNSPPLLSGALRGERLVLVDLAPAVGAPPEAARKGAKNGDDGAKAGGKAAKDGKRPAAARDSSDAVLPERAFDLPSLKAMNASVQIDLKRLDLPSEVLRSIAPLRAQLTLENGLLKLERLSATTAGGTVRGALSLDSNAQPPTWAADLAWSGVDLAKWITARNEKTKDGEPEPYVTGTLSGRAKLVGSGRSTASILGSLDGDLYAWVRDGRLSHLVVEALGLDVAQGLGLLAVGDDPLPLNCAVTQLKAENGLVRTQLALVDTPDSTVLVDGSVSLAQERLKLTMTAKPKDFSPLTVRAPVHIRGSFAEPEIEPDAKTLGVKAAAAALLAAINPLAALIPLMDPADPAVQQCADVVAGDRGGAPKAQSNAPPGARADAKEAAPTRDPLQ